MLRLIRMSSGSSGLSLGYSSGETVLRLRRHLQCEWPMAVIVPEAWRDAS